MFPNGVSNFASLWSLSALPSQQSTFHKDLSRSATGPVSEHQNYPHFLPCVACGVEANGDVNYKLLVTIISRSNLAPF